MKAFLLLVVGLVAVVAEEPILVDYHEAVGIPEAARIKALEEAADFDGSRIVGGSPANLGAYPYLGGLIVILGDGRQSVCGSSLLSNTRLVTAAHCWISNSGPGRQMTVVLGSIRLFSGGTRVNTNQVAVHASYNPTNLNNDVAMITIAWTGYTNVINRIAMATGSNTFAGVWANAAGFGRTADNANINTNQFLSHVSLQVITNAVCQRTFGNTIIASTLCTSGANGRNICGGDSGGPLVNGGQLIGISSFVALAGCQRGLPGGFARVTSFAPWISARL